MLNARGFLQILIVATVPRSWNGCGPWIWNAVGRKSLMVVLALSIAVFFSVAFCAGRQRLCRFVARETVTVLSRASIETMAGFFDESGW